MVQVSFEYLERVSQPSTDKYTALGELRERIEVCVKCPQLVFSRKLYPYGRPTCGYGNPNSPLFFIGEAPGMYGCGTTGIPFTLDRSGEFFKKILKEVLGMTHEDIWITNIVKCCPKDNRTPEPEERNNCTPFLVEELKIVKPFVIIPMGMSATKLFFPNLEEFSRVNAREYYLPSDMPKIGGTQWAEIAPHKAFLFPIWHPAYIIRDPGKTNRWKHCFKAINNLMTLIMGNYDNQRLRA